MKWALPVPLHLDPNDHSPEADELRYHLYEQFYKRTKGRGFRQVPGLSVKCKRSRRGRTYAFNRMSAIAINAKYGERTNA